jgi:predicted dehydrogenase
MQTLAVGVVGAGSIGTAHAEAIASERPELDVAAVADIDPDAGQTFAERFDAVHFEDAEQMYDEAAVDVVLVAVPNACHGACTVAALDRGLDVLCEKPLATSLDEAERIATAADDSEGTVMVGHTMVFKPTVTSLRKRLDAGEFGDLYDVELTYVRRRGIPQIGSWFTRKDAAGGGALIDCGVHLLSVAMNVLGDPDIETVSASTNAAFGKKPEYTYQNMWGGDPVDDPEFSVEDTVRALVRTADGTTLSLDCAWASNRPTTTSMRFLGSEVGATLDVHSEDATLYGTEYGQLTETRLEPTDVDLFAEEWAYFAAVVRGDRTHTRNTIDHALGIQRLIDAIYDSANRGEEVTVANGR